LPFGIAIKTSREEKKTLPVRSTIKATIKLWARKLIGGKFVENVFSRVHFQFENEINTN
jgi:hypothetical protein